VLAKQVLEHLANGATMGDMLGYDERDYELLYTIGHTLYVQGRCSDALKIFSLLLIHKPNERRFIKASAAALQVTKDYANAIRLYTIASVMDMTDPAPCFHTCECLLALGLRQEAAEGLAIVMQQCQGESLTHLRERAQALLDLLARPAASTPQEKAR
jgi:type III secretion system low calcium response chaperone LcrH/SycD